MADSMARRVTLSTLSKLGVVEGQHIGLGGMDENGSAVELCIPIKYFAAIMPLIEKTMNDVTGSTEGFFNATAVQYREEVSGHALLNIKFSQAAEVRARLAPVDVQRLRMALCGPAISSIKLHS
jgi:hypothetical protein